MDKFFEMLGSGSADEVPEGSDDDAATEEENSRQGVKDFYGFRSYSFPLTEK